MFITFELGKLYITAHAQEELDPADVFEAIRRHEIGDWGEIDEEDRQENELALREGRRVLSAYTGRNGVTFWIITEADRSSTTILLPENYLGGPNGSPFENPPTARLRSIRRPA